MDIHAHLQNLRAKPEHIRKRYAFWSAFGFTAVVAAFWVASFTTIGGSTHAAVASAVDKAGTPGQSLIAGVGSFFGDIRDLFFGPKKVSYSSVEVLPGKE